MNKWSKKTLIMTLFLVTIVINLSCTGQNGSNGSNGSSCSVSSITPSSVVPTGGALLQCTDGTQALIINGTVIQPVQFCLHPVTTYPSTFAEVGFCINGEIYAVYSANDGFLSPIPSGNYTSDGINASCNFTVTGCTI